MKNSKFTGTMPYSIVTFFLILTVTCCVFGESNASDEKLIETIQEQTQVAQKDDGGLDSIDEDKRAWDKLHGSGWGKRGWQDMQSSGWGKRDWKDMQASGWGKRDWKDMQASGWGKRGWQDMQSSGWGKRGWQDMQSSGWGKRGWQDMQSSGWGKRGWQDMQSSGWGKRGWKSLPGSGWGKRSLYNLENSLKQDYVDGVNGKTDQELQEIDNMGLNIQNAKRGWRNLKASWGKRSPQSWANLKGAWGKRDPAWHNLKGLWGKRSADADDGISLQENLSEDYGEVSE